MNNILPYQNNQNGAIHVLGLMGILGIATFVIALSAAPFKDKILSSVYPKPASHAAGIKGDFNGDGVVNILDQSLLEYRIKNSLPYDAMYDLNSDGIVNILDQSILASIIKATPKPSATATPKPALKGDFNGDGAVNVLDKSILLNRINTSAPYEAKYDLNNDWVVNQLDVSILDAIISATPKPSATATPKPTVF